MLRHNTVRLKHHKEIAQSRYVLCSMAHGTHLSSVQMMIDSRLPITESVVLCQLVECASRAGFLSPWWMSYRFLQTNGFTLRRTCVPLNVWHPYCGGAFYSAHPACEQLNIVKEDMTAGDDLRMRYVVSETVGLPLKWVAVCPSVSDYFHFAQNGIASPLCWVPSSLSRRVPSYHSCRVLLPPFQSVVNLDQLQPTPAVQSLITDLFSENR